MSGSNASETEAARPPRLTSIDAFRGLVMFLLLAEALHLAAVSEALPESRLWATLAYHQTHVEWIGCSLHDLIQPAFSFLVGVALPFSLANRRRRGQSRGQMTRHAISRALILIGLGVFLRLTGDPALKRYVTFEDTLTQIGLGYPFLFLLGFRPKRDHWIALAAILVGYWGLFALYPAPGTDFDYASVGVPADWPHLMTGFEAHWNKNSNPAWAFDRWWLNLFPRDEPFLFNRGGYATLSFIPTLGTMILGLIAGRTLQEQRPAASTLTRLVGWGLAGLAIGWGLGELGLCPVVKRIWTPSWTLFSGGWCFLALAAFHAVIDLWGWKRWAFPLVVIGMNSIAAYLISWLIEPRIAEALGRVPGPAAFQSLGDAYEPLLHGAAVLFVAWLILYWMYRQKLLMKI